MSTDVDPGRRRFLTATVGVVGGVGAVFAAIPFAASWAPSERAKAIGAPVEIDISKLEPGQRVTVKWRGKPVWVVRRTDRNLESVKALDGDVRDPDSAEDMQPAYAQNEFRSIKPEFLVLIGICTHLGCSPLFYREDDPHPLGPHWKGGFFCPCHGSLFDFAGRVFKGVPAPSNLEVPPYQYLTDTRIVVGVSAEAG